MQTPRDFKTLPLSDQFMFGEVMRHESICKLFLEELLQCKIAKIEFIGKEVDLSDTLGAHGIRLDVYLADENNTHYDIEMQNTFDALERRSRYYQCGIDRRILEKGQTYRNLPESFVIFVCNFDYFGLGWAYYEKEARVKGTDKVYSDGSHVIFLNAKYREKNGISPAIAEFLDYVRDADDGAAFATPLAQQAKQLTNNVRQDKEKEVAYMTLMAKMQETYEQGLKQGLERGLERGAADALRETVMNLLESMSVSQIAKVLKKPDPVIQAIADSLDDSDEK